MIIVKPKPIEEVVNMIGATENLLIVGCDGCVGIYQEGGQKQVELMKTILEMAKKLKENRDIKIKTAVVLRQCDRQLCATSLRPLMDGVDVVLSMACGIGVQTIAEAFEGATVIPAHDTLFMGMQDRELGKFYERCSGCGECILFETGGVCLVTRCAKGLLNGPCGGQSKGKCEVGGWVSDCAWILAYNRLKQMGRLDLFTKFREPRDHRNMQPPRELGGPEVRKA